MWYGISIDFDGSLEPSLDSTKLLPSSQAQNDVMPKLAIELTNVIVTERLTSPSNIAVQKFDAAPPGHDPSNINPSCS